MSCVVHDLGPGGTCNWCAFEEPVPLKRPKTGPSNPAESLGLSKAEIPGRPQDENARPGQGVALTRAQKALKALRGVPPARATHAALRGR